MSTSQSTESSSRHAKLRESLAELGSAAILALGALGADPSVVEDPFVLEARLAQARTALQTAMALAPVSATASRG